jgi:hypothetical protein
MRLPYFMSVYAHATEKLFLYVAHHFHLSLSKSSSHISLRSLLRLLSQGRNSGKHAHLLKLRFLHVFALFFCVSEVGFITLYEVS